MSERYIYEVRRIGDELIAAKGALEYAALYWQRQDLDNEPVFKLVGRQDLQNALRVCKNITSRLCRSAFPPIREVKNLQTLKPSGRNVGVFLLCLFTAGLFNWLSYVPIREITRKQFVYRGKRLNRVGVIRKIVGNGEFSAMRELPPNLKNVIGRCEADRREMK